MANEANVNDPLIIQKGSLKGLHDMLSGVRTIYLCSRVLALTLQSDRVNNLQQRTTSTGRAIFL